MKTREYNSDKWEYVRCNLCGSDYFKERCFYGPIRIVQCRRCGLVYRNPQLKEKINREFCSIEYYGEYESMEESISDARINLFKYVLSKLNQIIPGEGRRILDIGCGQGHFLKLAKDLKWNVQGVELAKSACVYAKERFGIELFNMALQAANFPDDYFDVVTMWNVLDHLNNPIGELQQIRRILKSKGILFIRVPNVSIHFFTHASYSFMHKILKNGKAKDPSVIINYGFNRRGLQKILIASNFHNIRIYNSPLSKGDPYRCFENGGFCAGINLIKAAYYFFALFLFYATFKKVTIGSSLLAYAQK